MLFIFIMLTKYLNTQVLILYFDFENNTTRPTLENKFEQAVNTGSGAISLADNVTKITSLGGAGILIGGSISSQAVVGSN